MRVSPGTQPRVTLHWRERVAQRIGAGVCPDRLAAELMAAIAAGDQRRVEFLGRVRRDGTRAFRFALLGGRIFVALIETGRGTLVTVLGEGQTVTLMRGEVVPCGASAVARQHLRPLIAEGV